MKITCPDCRSQYELDAAKLGPNGRKVRCAACGTQWHIAPEPEIPTAPSGTEIQAELVAELDHAAEIAAEVSAVVAEHAPVAPPAAEEPAAPRPLPRPRAASRPARAAAPSGIGLPLALALAGIGLFALLVWQRENAVRQVPQLAGLFEALGMPVNIRGLRFSAVEGGLIRDGQTRYLVVEGDVTNIVKRDMAMPPIEVSVRDTAGQTLYRWTVEPPRATLEPSELVRFRARLASPPENGHSVKVGFVADKAHGVARAP